MLIGHTKQWQFLQRKFEADQLSHAYLFSGQEQLGKKFLAKEFVKLLNCKSEEKPCQKCFSCTAIEKESFPDFLIIKPEDGGEISVAKIRDLQNFLSYKSYYGSFRAVIVDNAELMNLEAQSCFLKTLEEPKGKTIIFLITPKPETLLSTIFSRCQQIKFFPVSGYIDGKPGREFYLKNNPEILENEKKALAELLKVANSDLAERFAYAKKADLENGNLNKILELLQKYYRQEMLSKIGNFPETDKIKKDLKLIQEIILKVSLTNANPRLALEILLMELSSRSSLRALPQQGVAI